MSAHLEPKNPSSESESDFDATDGGWDPYITSLLRGATADASASPEDEDDGAPVMSFSRRPAADSR